MKSFILILAAFLLTAVHSIPSPAWVWIPEGAPPPPSTPPTTQENTSPETTSKLILVSANRNEYRLARASFSGDFAAKSPPLPDTNQSPVTGEIVFIQFPGVGTPVTITGQFFTGLTKSNKTYSWHIHEKPISNGDCVTTGFHFDPTNKAPKDVYTVSPTPGDLETYQAGDLSGKFGKLKPQNGGTTGFRITDPTITMNGDNSIVGRSVVIHDPDNNSRIGCANIDKIF